MGFCASHSPIPSQHVSSFRRPFTSTRPLLNSNLRRVTQPASHPHTEWTGPERDSTWMLYNSTTTYVAVCSYERRLTMTPQREARQSVCSLKDEVLVDIDVIPGTKVLSHFRICHLASCWLPFASATSTNTANGATYNHQHCMNVQYRASVAVIPTPISSSSPSWVSGAIWQGANHVYSSDKLVHFDNVVHLSRGKWIVTFL